MLYVLFGTLVLKYEKLDFPTLTNNSIHLKTIAAPVNPADINMVEGTYATLPPLPCIGGNEGVFEVCF